MKKLIVAFILLLPCFAQANEKPFFAGLGYHYGVLDGSSLSDDAKLGGIKLEGGKYFHRNFAVEGNLIIGISDDDVMNTIFGKETYELKYLFSVFFKPDWKVHKKINIYGLVGLSQAEIESTYTFLGVESTAEHSETSLSLGGGIEGMIVKNLYLGIEALMYYSDYSSVNLSLTYKF